MGSVSGKGYILSKGKSQGKWQSRAQSGNGISEEKAILSKLNRIGNALRINKLNWNPDSTKLWQAPL